jgi:hypothetical protein
MSRSKIITLKSPRKQHIIPRSYLEHFADRGGRLFVYEVGKPIRASVPSKEAAERDFFEYKVSHDETQFKFEKALGRIESSAAAVHSKLLMRVTLSAEEMAAWAMYVATMFLRSRRVRDELSVKLMEDDIARWMSLAHFRDMQWAIYRDHGRLVPVKEIEDAARRALGDYEIPAYRHIKAITSSAPKLANLLLDRRWQIVEASEGRSFPTCDAPAVSFQLVENGLYEGFGWGLPNVHVALPLDPTKMFIASPTDLAWHPELDAQNTDLMNLLILKFADRHVYSHRESLELQTIFSDQGRALVFGENAFRAHRV